MLVSAKSVGDFSRRCAGRRISLAFLVTHPHHPAMCPWSMPDLGVGLHEHTLGERGKFALDVDDAHLLVDHLLVTYRAMERQRYHDNTLPGSLQSLGDGRLAQGALLVRVDAHEVREAGYVEDLDVMV